MSCNNLTIILKQYKCFTCNNLTTMYFYFYILSCKDCDFCYIGHAVDLKTRMNLHSYSTYHGNTTHVYATIRENGGWDNWYYDILDEGEYVSERDALVRECEIFDLLLPSGWLLNKARPIRLPKDHPETRRKANEATARSRAKIVKEPKPLGRPKLIRP